MNLVGNIRLREINIVKVVFVCDLFKFIYKFIIIVKREYKYWICF